MGRNKECRQAALRFLSRREYSELELNKKLVAKGYSSKTSKTTVSKLVEDRLVSDERFAQAVVRVRARKGYGPIRIKSELQQKGVALELIGNCLTDSAYDWKERLEQVIAKKYADSTIEDHKEWNKRVNFLAYRGFSFDLINEVLKPRVKY